jgi:DNA (cytosine-5)-methyltransferase 1
VSSALRVVEVFSGAGGIAAGFARAGLDIELAFDFDADACQSYLVNLGRRPVRVDARDLLRLAGGGWRPLASIDLLVADPPCAPWSRAGNREGRLDPRDMLEVTVALVRAVGPRAFLIANTAGLDEAPHWAAVQETIGSLAREGYCVRDYARLDAVDYGVPQFRARPFWYGHRSGACIRWPPRTHGPSGECKSGTIAGVEPIRPYVTCRDSLGHLSACELGTMVRLRSRRVGPDDGALLVHPRHPINVVDAPSHTITTKGNGRGAQGASVLAWPWDQPVGLSASSEDALKPVEPSESEGSPACAVRLSETAAALLQGFPAGWVFAGRTKASRWSQIGQAMPPPLAQAVARSILAALSPRRSIQPRKRAPGRSVWQAGEARP